MTDTAISHILIIRGTNDSEGRGARWDNTRYLSPVICPRIIRFNILRRVSVLNRRNTPQSRSMENYNEFAAELAAEMAEENIISECAFCNGSGVIRTEDDWGEQAEECVCLKKYHEYY